MTAALAPSLHRRPSSAGSEPVWDAAARRVLGHVTGPLRVVGGPGTGKTTLLLAAVAQRVQAGHDPARTLVLVGSRGAAAELRGRLAGLGERATSREPLVRTVHSYAFGVLRLHAARHGDPPPRLLAGAEQDALVRDLLGGEIDGDVPGSGWPERVAPALGLPGFAAELRELLLRAAERSLGPVELAELGTRHQVAEWVAAGRFFRGYEQVTLLRGAAGRGAPQATAPALDAAELVAAALDALASDPVLLAAERERVRHLVVDDAQDLDPQQMELVRALGTTAATVLLAGDPDQAVLTFRGADPRGMEAIDAETVVLRVDHRSTPAVRRAGAALAARLPGVGVGRHRTGPPRAEPGARATPDGVATAAAVATRGIGASGAGAEGTGASGAGAAEGTGASGPGAAEGTGASGAGASRTGASGIAAAGSTAAAGIAAAGSAAGATATGPAGADPAGADRHGEGVELRRGRGEGSVEVRVFPSAAQEAGWIADQFRRAHLIEGVPWSRMAVLARSARRALPALRRALLAAGVPIAAPPDELPLARQPAVVPLLMVLRYATRPHELDADAATALLTSPLGSADPMRLRRLRRGLLRLHAAGAGSEPDVPGSAPTDVSGQEAERIGSDPLLVQALRAAAAGRPDPLVALPPQDTAPLRRVGTLLAVAGAAAGDGESVEEVLWRVWQACGLDRRWSDASARGGPVGAAADRDLDAVLALFDAAARFADRLPGADIAGFTEYLADQQLPDGSFAEGAPRGEAVELLTAHSARGREWDVVAVPGVQEGSWPDLRLRGSLLGNELLVDVVGGVATPKATVSRVAPLLAEERRLFYVACTRARQTLLVSAVQAEDEQPSRFLDELDPLPADRAERPVHRPGRSLVLAELVGELRRAVCTPADREHRGCSDRPSALTVDVADLAPGADPAAPAPTPGPRGATERAGAAETAPGDRCAVCGVADARRRRAAAQLARLAEAGVPGADPNTWYGVAPSSSAAPLHPPGAVVPVSPSDVEKILRCPLRWVLERHGGGDVGALAAVTGSLVHALVQAEAAGAPAAELDDALQAAWQRLDAGAPWFSRRELERVRGMLGAFDGWLRSSRAEGLQLVAVEQPVRLDLADTDTGEAPGSAVTLQLRGRVDRLETDAQGRPVVVDVKTGRTAVSARAAAEHAQLAVYQLAAALGAFGGLLRPDAPPGGARLVYLADRRTDGSAKEPVQPPLDADGVAAWRRIVRTCAEEISGTAFVARAGADCDRCPVRASCPAHGAGRPVPES